MPDQASEKALRPFWIHQLAEYLIGVALISQGMQDPYPIVPTVIGALIVVNAAMVHGPLGAFKFIGRRVHRWCDLGVAAIAVGAIVQPWVEVSSSGRIIVVAILLPYGFLWFYTDWAEKPARVERQKAKAGPQGETAGRTAGRLAGKTYVAARNVIKKQTDS